MKIWITRKRANSLETAGLDRLDVWFSKPTYYFRSLDEKGTLPFVDDYHLKGVRKGLWLIDHEGTLEKHCLPFGIVFGYGNSGDPERDKINQAVWKELYSHFHDEPESKWEQMESEGIVQLQQFLLEIDLSVNLKFINVAAETESLYLNHP